LAAHLQSPQIQAFLGAVMGGMAGQPDLTSYDAMEIPRQRSK
jgi:hypothetical protein